MSNPRPVSATLLQSAVDGLTHGMEREDFTILDGFKMQVRVMCVPVEAKCRDGSADLVPKAAEPEQYGRWGDEPLLAAMKEFNGLVGKRPLCQ